MAYFIPIVCNNRTKLNFYLIVVLVPMRVRLHIRALPRGTHVSDKLLHLYYNI